MFFTAGTVGWDDYEAPVRERLICNRTGLSTLTEKITLIRTRS